MNLILLAPLLLLSATSGFAADPQACPLINGHLADDTGINDIEIHTKLEATTYSYAFGSAPFMFFPANGREGPGYQNGDLGTVKLECGTDFVNATENSLKNGLSTLRIIDTGGGTYRVEGSGLYAVGTGSYHLHQ